MSNHKLKVFFFNNLPNFLFQHGVSLCLIAYNYLQFYFGQKTYIVYNDWVMFFLAGRSVTSDPFITASVQYLIRRIFVFHYGVEWDLQSFLGYKWQTAGFCCEKRFRFKFPMESYRENCLCQNWLSYKEYRLLSLPEFEAVFACFQLGKSTILHLQHDIDNS